MRLNLFRVWILMAALCAAGLGGLLSCGGTDTGNPSKQGAQPVDTASPLKGCDEDVFVCPSGAQVTRDPANSCQFKPCP